MYKQKRLSRIMLIRCQSYLVLKVPFLILGMYLISVLCFADNSVTATKDDFGTTPATFTISYAQEIQWVANYQGFGTEGNDFYLHTNPSNLIEIPLSTNLSPGYNTGTHYLNPDTYSISINYFGMGPGSYSIIYNRTASIGVSPSSYNFGSFSVGQQSSTQSFTIFSTGDLPVRITAVNSGDPTHFEIINAPIGQTVPNDKSFQVRYIAGTSPGPYSATITISGVKDSDNTPVPDQAVNVSGTTVEPVASFAVSASSYNFGSILEGQQSSLRTFTLSSTGDTPVEIVSVVSGDPAHFVVSNSPAGQNIPPDRTFQVRFVAGNVPGFYSANITITGEKASDSTALAPRTVNVSGTTVPVEPDIACSGNDCASAAYLGEADHTINEVKTLSYSFSNNGNMNLSLTSIYLINDSATPAFTLASQPSLSPVSANGGTRSVSIRFAPPVSGGEATYCGHLEITSDDPDETVKNCYFSARAHHPEPRMSLSTTTINYYELELGFSLERQLVVSNNGDARLDITITDNTPTNLIGNLVHWSDVDQSTNIPANIEQGESQEFTFTYAPQDVSGGVPHTIILQVAGNDLTNLTEDVTLIGEGIPPIPIDTVLVLDRSGSMADPAGSRYKIDALRDAASLFTNLLRPSIPNSTYSDGIGFVRYNHNNDPYLPVGLVSNSTHLSDANTKLDNNALQDVTNGLKPYGATGIGGAMQTAAGMFTVPAIGRKHVMVVLTDGIENRTPRIADVHDGIVQGNPHLHIYSVGLGDQHESAKLLAITNVTNGYHQVSGTLEGTELYDLELFYFKIFANATDLQIAADPTFPVYIGGTTPLIVASVGITSSDRSAVFLVLDEEYLRQFYDLELIDPQGQVIQLGAIVGGVPVHQFQQYNYTIYKVVFPDLAQSLTYVGNWDLRLTPNGKFNLAGMKIHKASMSEAGYVYTSVYQGIAPVGFAVAVGSDYRMKVDAVPSHLQPGATIAMLATLTDRGTPVDDATVTVDITTPSGTQYQNVVLVPEGNGNWAKNFSYTGEEGSYRFWFRSIGRNFRGETVRREDTRFVTLTYPKPEDGREKPCIPCWLLRLLWILVILLLLLFLIRCCRRRHPITK